MTAGRPVVSVWSAPGVFGPAVLIRSLAEALAGLPVDVAADAGGEPGAVAFLIAGALPSDVAATRARRAAIAGLVPDDRCFRVAMDGDKGSGVRAALGSDTLVWPADTRAVLAADRDETTLQRIDPRSRLVSALNDAGARVAASLRRAPPALDLDAAARAIADRVWSAMDGGAPADLESVIDRELAAHLCAGPAVVSAENREALRRRLRQELVGFGPIEPFFDDPTVSEIMVNGAGHIYLERNGRMERSSAVYASEDRLRLAISRIVGPAGRRVDASSPLCDVRLPDGSRANVVLPPVSVSGPILTVRRFRPAFDRLEDLIAVGALTADQAETLSAAVRDRRNLLIAGNSGAGKTTLLNALAALIPDEERILTMEDAAELRIRKPHVVRLETRPPNAEGEGEITMRDLVVNALRMRPDRLVIGECRGAEAVPMLQAMNTGHDGSMTTVHANSAGEALARLEAMTLIGAPHWPADVVRRQIAAAIHLIVYLRRTGGRRRVEAILPVAEARA